MFLKGEIEDQKFVQKIFFKLELILNVPDTEETKVDIPRYDVWRNKFQQICQTRRKHNAEIKKHESIK